MLTVKPEARTRNSLHLPTTIRLRRWSTNFSRQHALSCNREKRISPTLPDSLLRIRPIQFPPNRQQATHPVCIQPGRPNIPRARARNGARSELAELCSVSRPKIHRTLDRQLARRTGQRPERRSPVRPRRSHPDADALLHGTGSHALLLGGFNLCTLHELQSCQEYALPEPARRQLGGLKYALNPNDLRGRARCTGINLPDTPTEIRIWALCSPGSSSVLA